MKAVVQTIYGPPSVLTLKEVETPIPKDNEIQIKIHATTVNTGDIWARNFRKISPFEFSMPFIFWLPAKFVFGIRKPRTKILGSEFAGEINAIGKDVTLFKKGDHVFGYRGQNFGGNAEYLCMPENGIVSIKPDNMTFEQAASIPYGSLTALNILRKVNIKKGDKVLINGASGSIGNFAVQLSKYYGAEVTGVCSTTKMEYVGALGADNVIDYTKEDFAKNGESYDIILDIMNKSSYSHCKGSLTQNGTYVLVSFKMRQIFQMLRTKIIGSKKVLCALSMETPEDLVHIRELAEKGSIKSIIDKEYPIEELVAAHEYVEKGLKKGHVVIIIKSNSDQ